MEMPRARPASARPPPPSRYWRRVFKQTRRGFPAKSDTKPLAGLGREGGFAPPPGKPSLFKPALFLVIFLRAGMQRGRKAVLHHLRCVQIGEGWVQRLELVEILEHRLGELIDGFLRH